ncbi:TonB-dependent receptor [Pedosphaera parvula]|uniref:TonB-dependent receptor n=1 Tax=Pedosphaera parvula (strain Ellin514) TaxID=320771 RepID=B9XKR1_PEDPL|nr:TonB-dependent receptor [Pedosphaera parvula]EEF59554.1 TonB-dependent receptor [Pedosphaera parvula Ellin514]
MKTFSIIQKHSVLNKTKVSFVNQRAYWAAIWLASLSCGSIAQAQTNEVSASAATASSGSSTNVSKLENVTVFGQLEEARNKIVADLGATTYTITQQQIEAQSQGQNASFNQVLLRAPGVAQDSFGQIHVRGEHANLQYRINDVILPEGISGFGQTLDTRFVNQLELITGTLPAQYGFRTAGVVDIHTKNGAFNSGGDASLYGGSFSTIQPSFEYGGKQGDLNYYYTGSYLHTGQGIENPTGSNDPIHDNSDQFKGFAYLSYVLDDTSRLSLMLSGAHGYFQVPNNPNQPPGTDPNGNPFPLGGVAFNSSSLNENQTEQNYYGVLAYQKILGDLNFQLAGFSSYSSVLFRPDSTGDLFFNGVASRVDRHILTQGVQGDSSYDINEAHTLRGGIQGTASKAVADTSTTVFAIDGAGNAVPPPFAIVDNNSLWGYLFGAYLQDEWKITDKWTVNFGARVDAYHAVITESEFEPRLNAIFKATEKTTLHAGYARYFTPPPLESISRTTVAKFENTSNAAANSQNDPVRAERSHYFDVGATQTLVPGLNLGLDGYYKIAKNQLDEGQFGQALIETPFNYNHGEVYGVELSATYKKDGFSAFGNFAYSVAKAHDINSAQFNFDPADLAYIKNHDIFVDHNQTFTGSVGVSYQWRKTLAYVDMLYGNGLRADGAVPNGRKLNSYSPVNLGIEHSFQVGKNLLKARFDVVNVFDETYELRDGTGIGVGAPQFGSRRGFYGTLSYVF